MTDAAVGDDRGDGAKRGDVSCGVAVDDEDVGVEPGTESTFAVRESADLRRGRGGGGERVVDRYAGFVQVDDRLGKDAVTLAQRDAGVVAGDDLHTAGVGTAEHLPAEFQGHSGAGQHLLDARRWLGVERLAEGRTHGEVRVAEAPDEGVGHLETMRRDARAGCPSRRPHRRRWPARRRRAHARAR